MYIFALNIECFNLCRNVKFANNFTITVTTVFVLRIYCGKILTNYYTQPSNRSFKNGLVSHESLLARQLEYPTGVRKVRFKCCRKFRFFLQPSK